MSDFIVECISTEQTKAIRHQVLWPHKTSLDVCVLETDDLTDAFHVGTWDRGKVISTGSFFPQQHQEFSQQHQYRLRAMATYPNYQGLGAGRRLIEFALKKLRERNVELLWCDARLVAEGFYKNLGFRVKDEIYEVPLIGPHKLMWYEL